MDGRDEIIRLRGEEIERLNAQLDELGKHADHLNSRIVALDDRAEFLLARIDDYTEMRERVSCLSANDDPREQRIVLDAAVQAWHRLLDSRKQFSSDSGANR